MLSRFDFSIRDRPFVFVTDGDGRGCLFQQPILDFLDKAKTFVFVTTKSLLAIAIYTILTSVSLSTFSPGLVPYFRGD